jgi:cell division protein FtsB
MTALERELRARIAELEAEVRELRAEVEELERRSVHNQRGWISPLDSRARAGS